MIDSKEVFERFEEAVKDHVVTVEHAEGVFRHLVCKRPGTGIHGFSITTWPGYLAITGDMGTYVFSRLDDMFRFFWTDKEPWCSSFGYYAEKCQAADETNDIRRFSLERFHKEVEDWISEWPEGAQEQARESLMGHYDNEYEAREAARDFYYRDIAGEYNFDDFFEACLVEFTYHYLWCCYAIGWAINKYYERTEGDKTKGV